MNKRKKILILGATGQDGSFMAKFMHEKNYFVHCVVRKSSTGNLKNLKDLINKQNFFIHHGDLLDLISIEKIIKQIKKAKTDLKLYSVIIDFFLNPPLSNE